jgi:glycogen debranching enzyme
MDARVNGRVITPRVGKPVEVQALWINALRVDGPGRAAERATAAFRAALRR